MNNNAFFKWEITKKDKYAHSKSFISPYLKWYLRMGSASSKILAKVSVHFNESGSTVSSVDRVLDF